MGLSGQKEIEGSKMIFDQMKYRENYSGLDKIAQALAYLAEQGEKLQELQKSIKLTEDICINPVSFTSKPEADCLFEAHRKYIDVHYILAGEEKIATADVHKLKEEKPFDAEKDIGFYTGTASGSYVLKAGGDFMICFPSDAHKVGMMTKTPADVKKIVAKIRF